MSASPPMPPRRLSRLGSCACSSPKYRRSRRCLQSSTTRPGAGLAVRALDLLPMLNALILAALALLLFAAGSSCPAKADELIVKAGFLRVPHSQETLSILDI